MYSRDPVIPLVNNYNILTIKNKIHKVAETYMNNTELILALDRGMIQQDLGVEMQAVAQYWEHLLYTTRGAALALEKFFFVAIDWNFNQDEYSLKPQKEMDLAIHLTSGEAGGTPTSVPHKDAQEGPRNLGARLAPDGNSNDELQHLIMKGGTSSQNNSASKLQRHI